MCIENLSMDNLETIYIFQKFMIFENTIRIMKRLFHFIWCLKILNFIIIHFLVRIFFNRLNEIKFTKFNGKHAQKQLLNNSFWLEKLVPLAVSCKFDYDLTMENFFDYLPVISMI